MTPLPTFLLVLTTHLVLITSSVRLKLQVRRIVSKISGLESFMLWKILLKGSHGDQGQEGQTRPPKIRPGRDYYGGNLTAESRNRLGSL